VLPRPAAKGIPTAVGGLVIERGSLALTFHGVRCVGEGLGFCCGGAIFRCRVMSGARLSGRVAGGFTGPEGSFLGL
jgi:hypothetical protein